MKLKKILIAGTMLLSITTFAEIKTAYVAGGCFWCTESDMEKIPGVIEVISGYSGGDIMNPTYEQVESGTTGHRESIEIKYDNEKISYLQLIIKFLKTIDPTDMDGQFVDRGIQYSPAIFYQNTSEKDKAIEALKIIQKEGGFSEMKVKVIPFKNFYPAEEYHQDYYKKNPIRYNYYRHRSGRDQFLEKTWNL